jgi:hypothetical protein
MAAFRVGLVSSGQGDDVRGPGGHGPGEDPQVRSGAGGWVAAGSGEPYADIGITSTCSGIWKTPPRTIRMRSGPARSPMPGGRSSTPPTWPAAQGLRAVPAEMTVEHLTLFRRGVAVGYPTSAAPPAPRASSRRPGRCSNACATAKPTCCGS